LHRPGAPPAARDRLQHHRLGDFPDPGGGGLSRSAGRGGPGAAGADHHRDRRRAVGDGARREPGGRLCPSYGKSEVAGGNGDGNRPRRRGMTATLVIAVIASLPLAGALLAILFGRHGGALALATAVGVAVAVAVLVAEVAQAGAVGVEVGGWETPLGIRLETDGMSGAFL